ncbi:MAG: hypothetical protein MSC45_00095 [Mobiluncus sp.]|uniref:hypothetical protein n=1 Tax=Mobiluncus sp. TaxID=47293 RepID=UPI00258AC91F|nr:hypothetical protein [Mobiluncus sp.]MCI6583455.1 hypothetical protein [Mobiluncus sp.]
MGETTITMAELKKLGDHAELIGKALETVAFIAKPDVPIIESFFDTATGDMLKLPEGWWGLGMVTTDGWTFSNESESNEVQALGYADPVRIDNVKNTRTISVTALEKYKKQLIELSEGVDLSAVKMSASGEVKYDAPAIAVMKEYRLLTIARDGAPGDERYDVLLYPRVQLTKFPESAWNTEAMQVPLEFKAMVDTKAGTACRRFLGGPWMKKHAGATGFEIESAVSPGA